MPQIQTFSGLAAPEPAPTLRERLRGALGHRAAGIALTLALEALLVLVLLTFGPRIIEPKRVAETTTVLNIEAPPALQPAEAPPEFAAEAPGETAPTPPDPVPNDPEPVQAQKPDTQRPDRVPPPDVQVTKPPALIPMTPNQMAAADLSKMPGRPAKPAAGKPMMGPVGSARSSDTARVGTAPNGEPLYAAAWYREPTEQEMRGYLSTAQGPGWGLVACRTVAEFRVDSCVALDETPGSNINRAVLAAAWQFRVRPPRLGGENKYGTWVRIRIDYGNRSG